MALRCKGSPTVYNLLVMVSRCARLMAVVLLATFALDIADADCAAGAQTSDAAHACLSQGQTIRGDPPGNCACCIAAEAACPVSYMLTSESPAAVVVPASDGLRAGVHPSPYRPPLRLS